MSGNSPITPSLSKHTLLAIVAVITGTAVILIEYLLIQPWKENSKTSAIASKIEGRWEYTVINSITDFSHKGDCMVRMDKDELLFDGIRRWKCSLVAEGTDPNKAVCLPTNSPWSSNWAELCHDGDIRCEYAIKDEGRTIHGYFVIHFDENDPHKMDGHFYFLPPAPADVPAAQHGTIQFKRLLHDDPVGPPLPHEMIKQREIPSNSKEAEL